MKLTLYNTLTRCKEAFTPIDPSHIKMYVCGPTVYDRAHIGNARAFIVFDVLFRLLQHLYPNITYVRNITDVDDKIIKAAQEKGELIDDLTNRMTDFFHQDMKALGALSPTHEPRATHYISEMQAMIQTLIQKGYAYETEGHVLFSVSKDPTYGQLSHLKIEDRIVGARVEVAPYKKDPQDFVLWKPSSSEIPGWTSPWGRGRPGWHIECSAMADKLLGDTFDIHAGGLDLIFPHHENEIAQSRCAHAGKPLANFWIHNGHLMVNGEKMSKSLGNFLTVQDLLEKFPGEVIRLVLISTHYHQPLDWTEASAVQAKKILDRFYTALKGFQEEQTLETPPPLLEALLEDLNTPLALHHMHEMVTKINTASTLEEKRKAQSQLKAGGLLLGILEHSTDEWFKGGENKLEASEIETLIQEREEARRLKEFKKADAIRLLLDQAGILLEDGPKGTEWKRK